ncbi:MIP/aquaporin family protein [Marinilactibacillus psychrotolerans]|uniref:Glycerol uptake facilitator protein n=1 Tax=Marinilactibacillus psychrotolerans TaxID=191770 RepID=A0AAV3WS39_9LACT|nr:MIP/aquaporin family protein [Marinilactibacillus psychrotolerans]GEL67139.1 glycerol transporter [Marinilactibacillus psychrotolerans]GEQ35448.1 glycerol uptake facilitator protein [Marinilactibacillus psychrotolerans]SDC88525.1 glycerol uptake facilitator protein [Marinilactibacillus psychrotolerans]
MTGDMLTIFSEFLGTMILILLGDGVVAAVSLKKSKAEGAGWVAITMGWGAGVAMAVYIAGFMGPAHLNPAVTLGMAMIGNLEWAMVIPFILAQTTGAIVGAVLVWLTYLAHFRETTDQGAILGTFATAPEIYDTVSNVMSEAIGTFVLVFGIMAFGQNSFTDGLNPLVVGVLILSIGLSLGGSTGYAINPARDLGPRIAHAFLPLKNKGGSNWGYSWIPVAAPMLGAVLAALLYMVIV